MLCCWQKPVTGDYGVSVSVLLPSGIGENAEDIDYEVVSGSISLRITMTWPK
eukprot:IDg4639t1